MLRGHLPAGAQVALASRVAPALGVARLRASRALVEVHAHDLAMSAREASGLLRAAGLDLGPAPLERLVARTEGWPAALYLAALSLRCPERRAGRRGPLLRR